MLSRHARGCRATSSPSLVALLQGIAVNGAAITLTRCDVAAAEEASVAFCTVDAVLHAGGVLRVRMSPLAPGLIQVQHLDESSLRFAQAWLFVHLTFAAVNMRTYDNSYNWLSH